MVEFLECVDDKKNYREFLEEKMEMILVWFVSLVVCVMKVRKMNAVNSVDRKDFVISDVKFWGLVPLVNSVIGICFIVDVMYDRNRDVIDKFCKSVDRIIWNDKGDGLK